MKKNMKSIFIFLCAVCCLLFCMSVAQAEEPWTMELTGKTQKAYLLKDFQEVQPDGYGPIRSGIVYGPVQDGLEISCKSSNPGVASIGKYRGDYNVCYYYVAKKTGKTTITTTIKYEGITYTYKTSLEVFKWENPLQVLKVGKVSFLSKFNKAIYYNKMKTTTKGKLNVVAKKGWKVTSIKYTVGDKTPQKITNNTKVNFGASGLVRVEITCKNLKQKKYHTISMYQRVDWW